MHLFARFPTVPETLLLTVASLALVFPRRAVLYQIWLSNRKVRCWIQYSGILLHTFCVVEDSTRCDHIVRVVISLKLKNPPESNERKRTYLEHAFGINTIQPHARNKRPHLHPFTPC